MTDTFTIDPAMSWLGRLHSPGKWSFSGLCQIRDGTWQRYSRYMIHVGEDNRNITGGSWGCNVDIMAI